MEQVGGYQVVAVVPSSFGEYTIWAYRPPQQSGAAMATAERALYRSGPGRHRSTDSAYPPHQPIRRR